MVKVAIVGGGLLGVKIAGDLAYHGHTVKIYDRNMKTLDSIPLRIEEDKQELKDEGILVQANYTGRIVCLSQLEETVCDAEFIFEAVADDLEVKQDVFERVSHCCRATAVVATNTLALSVDSITQRMAHSERALGLRFLYPVYCISEIEVTPSTHTSAETMEKVRVFMEKMGKTLFLRSGSIPLILNIEQRESRKMAYAQSLKNQRNLAYMMVDRLVPELAHRGNILPGDPELDGGSYGGEDHDCAICMDNPRNCVLRPCHHMCTCNDCGQLLLNRRDGCPICRKEIAEVIRVFHS
ncbi:PREDICTED: probable 3-hydroxybutyryl-CoA dehydrogenase [Priapulus caudatus]|uniref:Probable 3-hydroxybutyryl-CoA dehydrogenase n=1 Tax=Priapulus caudatus TaxID=37621 RepID=A0ABM1EQF4_PRICU|nr:PREDICTED: probable 3-hydroxybutyryl-CoA dehydrogenase [Priapulus caudatus]